MKGNQVNREVTLLEELMKDKEVIFRQEISTLQNQVSDLKGNILHIQK